MTTQHVADIRRENLRALIKEHYENNNAAFCRAASIKNHNGINLVLTDNLENRRNMGEKVARAIEVNIGLPRGYLDVPQMNTANGSRVYTFTVVGFDSLDAESLERVVLKADVIARHLDSPSAMTNVRAVFMQTGEMSPAINKDDLVFVDTGCTKFEQDGVYVILRDKEAFVRRVRRSLAGGIKVSADSDPGGSIEVEPDAFQLAGRVVGVMKFGQI